MSGTSLSGAASAELRYRVAGGRYRIQVVHAGRQDAQELAESRLVSWLQAREQVLLGAGETGVQVLENLAPMRSGGYPAAAAVGGVGLTLDQAGAFQVVEQVGHDRAVDAQALGHRGLAARLVASGGAQHLVAAVAAGNTAGHGVGRLYVRPEHYGEAPAEVIREPGDSHPSMVRPCGRIDSL